MNGQSLNFLKLNIRWLLSGILLLVLGYIALGWTATGATSFEERTFAWNKVTLAPFILILGYVFIGVSIMIRSKK